MKITNVFHVAERRLCIGCGACYYACAEYRMKGSKKLIGHRFAQIITGKKIQ